MHTCHGFSIFVIQNIKEGRGRGEEGEGGWGRQKYALHKREDWQGMSPFPPIHLLHQVANTRAIANHRIKPTSPWFSSLHYGLKSTTPPCTPIAALFIINFKFLLQPHQKY